MFHMQKLCDIHSLPVSFCCSSYSCRLTSFIPCCSWLCVAAPVFSSRSFYQASLIVHFIFSSRFGRSMCMRIVLFRFVSFRSVSCVPMYLLIPFTSVSHNLHEPKIQNSLLASISLHSISLYLFESSIYDHLMFLHSWSLCYFTLCIEAIIISLVSS